eukprot:g14835.t1
MPRLCKKRRGALEALREANRTAAAKAEDDRLQAALDQMQQRRERMEDNMENMEYLELQKMNVFNVSSYYINYDGLFQTRRMSAMLFNELAEAAGYLTADQREQLYGKTGFVNRGFPVEGPVPVYGAWAAGKPLTTVEKQKLLVARAELQLRLSGLDEKHRLRGNPYEFETPQTMAKCYAAVRKLMNGPLATEVPEADVPMGTWVFPFFGLGQKWRDETGQWKKVRPIANEKRRNNECSPVSEHLDVIDSLDAGRAKAALKAGERLQWKDATALPANEPAFSGHSFVPTLGKLDLFQAVIYDLTKSQHQFYEKARSPRHAKPAVIFLRKMQKEVLRREPMILSREEATRPRVNICTDAAQKDGMVALGGMIFDCDKNAKGFSIYLQQKELPIPLRRGKILCCELLATRLTQYLFEDETRANHCIFLGDNAAATFGIVLRKAGWKAFDQLKPTLIEEKRGNISNVYNGVKLTASLEWWAQQLQSYTYDNLSRYAKLYAPTRANPPDLSKLPLLTVNEQKIYVMWASTGLRKSSFASVRLDLAQMTDDRQFVRITVPSVKAVPVPGETFSTFIPRAIFFSEVFPVSETQLDIIARKMGTTSHGVRRALALYLRRRAAELGPMPREDGTSSVECQTFKNKVNYFFGWTHGSTMWEEHYSTDVVNFVNCDFTARPAIDKWFTGLDLLAQAKVYASK